MNWTINTFLNNLVNKGFHYRKIFKNTLYDILALRVYPHFVNEFFLKDLAF
jgi:hypothetical protein